MKMLNIENIITLYVYAAVMVRVALLSLFLYRIHRMLVVMVHCGSVRDAFALNERGACVPHDEVNCAHLSELKDKSGLIVCGAAA